MEEAIKRWERLTYVPKSILTPSLSGKKRLNNSYLRFLFIAQTIEYLAHKSIFEKETFIGGQIITEAVALTYWRLGNISCAQLDLMLAEMAVGLELLDAKDLGTYDTIDYKGVDKDGNFIVENVKAHCGFAYTLSEKGWEAYRSQEYTKLVAQLQSTRIRRIVSYIALAVSIMAVFIRILF